jgi:hypothetical protein
MFVKAGIDAFVKLALGGKAASWASIYAKDFEFRLYGNKAQLAPYLH